GAGGERAVELVRLRRSERLPCHGAGTGLSGSLRHKRGLKLRSTLPSSVLPDIAPTWGEIGCHLRFRQSPAVQNVGWSSGRPISPHVGEMSGRTEGGAVPPPLGNGG